MKTKAQAQKKWLTCNLAALSAADAQRSCYGKVGFASKTMARDAAIRAAKAESLEFRSYKCPVCHQFHLTTTAASERAAIKSAMRRRSML